MEGAERSWWEGHQVEAWSETETGWPWEGPLLETKEQVPNFQPLENQPKPLSINNYLITRIIKTNWFVPLEVRLQTIDEVCQFAIKDSA